MVRAHCGRLAYPRSDAAKKNNALFARAATSKRICWSVWKGEAGGEDVSGHAGSAGTRTRRGISAPHLTACWPLFAHDACSAHDQAPMHEHGVSHSDCVLIAIPERGRSALTCQAQLASEEKWRGAWRFKWSDCPPISWTEGRTCTYAKDR